MTHRAPGSSLGRAARGLIAMLLLAATPAGAATLSLPATTTIDGVGAVQSVAVTIDSATGIEGVDLRLTFNPAMVALNGDAVVGGAGAGCTLVSNAMGAELRLGLACAMPLGAGGTLLTIPLRGVAPGSSTLAFSLCDLNEGSIACVMGSAGSIVVSPPTPTPTATFTATLTRTNTATRTPTATATRTGTATRTSTATRTLPPTTTATPTTGPPAPLTLNALAGPIVIGQSLPLSGTGFTSGSLVVLFVSTATGIQSFGPFTPSPHNTTTMSCAIPTSVPLGNGFGTVVVVNSDQGFVQSNAQSQLLYGAAAQNIPTILGINGVPLRAFDATVPIASVETTLAPGALVTISGSGFNAPLVNLFSATGPLGPLTPSAGGNATAIQVTIPANAPTGPGAFQVVNSPYSGNVVSNSVSVPIGAALTLTGVTQSGSTVTVTGTGFSVVSVINLFNRQGSAVVNLGGYDGAGAARIPLTLSGSTQFSFAVPAGAVSGPSYVQVLNPPYIPSSSSGADPDGGFTLSVP